MQDRTQIRILFLGDPGSGKTSLILSTKTSTFAQVKIPPTIPQLIRDVDGIQQLLIDTSSKPADQSLVDNEIKNADYICILYNLTDPFPKSADSIKRWITHVSNLRRDKVPMTVIGTRADLKKSDPKKSGTDGDIAALISLYDEVEDAREISCFSKSKEGITTFLLNVQDAVLYPRLPLADKQCQLTLPFMMALRRIFQLADTDKDGYLDTEELRAFQIQGFGVNVDVKTIRNVKEHIQAKAPNGVTPRGVNELGFITMFYLFLEMKRTETIWRFLWSFGYVYDQSLHLSEAFLCPPLVVPEGHFVILSEEGSQFLRSLFLEYSKHNSEHILTWMQLERMFAVVPDNAGHPWEKFRFPACCQTRPIDSTLTLASFDDETISSISYDDLSRAIEHDPVTLNGFIAMWHMTTFMDYKIALRYLHYLGFRGTDCVTFTQKQSTFLACVLGPPGCGKTTLIRSFLDKQIPNEEPKETHQGNFGVQSITASPYYLILNEPDPVVLKNLVNKKQDEKLRKYDLFLILYEEGNDESFIEAKKLYTSLDKNFLNKPFLFVGTKTDLPPKILPNSSNAVVPQNVEPHTPKAFCQSLGLPAPILICALKKNNSQVFQQFIEHVLEFNPKSKPLIPRSNFNLGIRSILGAFFGTGLAIWMVSFLPVWAKNVNINWPSIIQKIVSSLMPAVNFFDSTLMKLKWSSE